VLVTDHSVRGLLRVQHLELCPVHRLLCARHLAFRAALRLLQVRHFPLRTAHGLLRVRRLARRAGLRIAPYADTLLPREGCGLLRAFT